MQLFSFFSLPLTAPQYGQTSMEPSNLIFSFEILFLFSKNKKMLAIVVKSFDELKPIFDQVNLDEPDSATTSIESPETTPSLSTTATTTSDSETSTKSSGTQPTSTATPSSSIVTQTTPSSSSSINSNTPSSTATNSVQATVKSPTPTTTLNTRPTLTESSTPTTMTIAANVPGSIDDVRFLYLFFEKKF